MIDRARSIVQHACMTTIIERCYGNDNQTPEMECSNDIVDKTYKGYALVSHTSIPTPRPGKTWPYFIHAVFRLDNDRSIG